MVTIPNRSKIYLDCGYFARFANDHRTRWICAVVDFIRLYCYGNQSHHGHDSAASATKPVLHVLARRGHYAVPVGFGLHRLLQTHIGFFYFWNAHQTIKIPRTGTQSLYRKWEDETREPLSGGANFFRSIRINWLQKIPLGRTYKWK